MKKERLHNNENNNEKETLRKVTDILNMLGIPRNLLGFDYIRTGILFLIEEETYKRYISKWLYIDIAKEYKNYEATPSRVERSIRHAIEIAWSRGNEELIKKMFGYTISSAKGRPTNSEFMCLVADEIKHM